MHRRRPAAASRRGPIAFVIALLIAPMCAPIAAAQISAGARLVAGPNAIVNQRVDAVVDITYQDADLDPGLRVPDNTSDLRFDLVKTADASSTSLTIVNGRRSQRTTLRRVFYLDIRPTEAGIARIPPMEVLDADGRGTGVFTPALRLNVEPPSQRDDFRVTLDIGDDDVWLGQPLDLTMTLLIDPRARPRNIEFDTGAVERVLRPIEDHDGLPDRREGVLRFLGKPLDARDEGNITADGATLRRYTVTRRVRAIEPGTFDLGPIAVFADLRPADFRRFQRVGVQSNTPTIRVRPLPADDRPARFDGLIGRFNVSTELSSTDARVGDPLTLRVAISGDPPLERVMPPRLAEDPVFTARFRVRRIDEPAERRRNTRIFAYTLRPLSDAVDQVPPVAIPHFDPDAGAYRTARSTPIPISVEAAERVTIDTAPADRGITAADDATTLTDAADQLRADAPARTLLDDDAFDIAAAVRRPLVVAAIAAPPACYALALTAVAFARRKRNAAHSRSPSTAARDALAVLEGAAEDGMNEAERVRRAVAVYAAARIAADPAAVTLAEALQRIAHDRPDLRDDARTLAQHTDAARFGGPSAAANTALTDETRTLLRNLAQRKATHRP